MCVCKTLACWADSVMHCLGWSPRWLCDRHELHIWGERRGWNLPPSERSRLARERSKGAPKMRRDA